MRVLQFSKFFPPVHGGIERAAHQLTECLSRHGVHTDVLCVDPGPSASIEQTAAGYGVYRMPVDFTLASLPVSRRILPLARDLMARSDVVHVHMPNPLAAMALARYRPAAKVVLHWHSDVVRQRFTRWLYEPLQRWVLQRADAIIATSPDYARTSVALAPFQDKVRVIPIGIEDPVGRVDGTRVANIRARYGGRPLVLAVGRMTYYKGFDVLIESASLLDPDVQVLIVGSGSLGPMLAQQVRHLGLAGRVHLLGALDEASLLAHHAAADVFCLPSVARSEAYGIVMLEAMAFGRPVVCSRVEGSGMPWITLDGVTGLTVKPGRADELAHALRRLIDNPELAAQLGRAGRQRFAETFQADLSTQQVLALYRSLVRVPTQTGEVGGRRIPYP